VGDHPIARFVAELLRYKTKNSDEPCGSSESFVNPGNDLVSHAVARAVPSALRGLTSVFGMGTGVTLSVRSPETRLNLEFWNLGISNIEAQIPKLEIS
jgi:hypothetical protein